jgi:hypothetical protein
MLADDALMVNKGALYALEVGRHVRLQYGMAAHESDTRSIGAMECWSIGLKEKYQGIQSPHDS